MGGRITVSHDAIVHPRWDENGRGKCPRTLGGDKSQVVVALHVLLFEFIELFDAINSERLHLFFEIVGGEFGNVSLLRFAIPIGRDEIVGLAEDFVQAKGEVGHGPDCLELQ